MRNLFVTKNSATEMFPPGHDKPFLHDWEFETPKDIRASAIQEFTIALKTNKQKVWKGDIPYFKMSYKSKKKKSTESIAIPKTSIKFKNGKVFVYSTFLKGGIRLGKKKGRKYKNVVEMDSRLTYDGHDFYLLLPRNIKVQEKTEKNKIVALDPGVRTFQTGFSEDEVFKGDIRRNLFEKLKRKIEILQSLRDTRRHDLNQRNMSEFKYRQRTMKLHKRIRNMVDDCHWQVINHLIKNYNDVLLPTFESQEMVMGTHLRKKTKNTLLSLSHYKFKVRICEKAKEYKNFRVHDVNEAYTSKTCSSCGAIHKTLNGQDTYTCIHCKMCMDRDVNGARNIFLKYVSL